MDQLNQQFKLHYFDKVTLNQTTLTNQLTRTLTDLNLRRLEQYSVEAVTQPLAGKIRKEDYLYVCITGLPSMDNQFEGLGIPGEKLLVYPECFLPNITEQECKVRVHFAQIQKQAESLHNRLQQHKTAKPLVFIFHSFGTTIVSALFRLYYNEYLPRVKGMIPMGGYPIRPDHSFRDYVLYCESLSKDYLFSHADELFEMHKELYAMMKIPNNNNKYANLASYIAFGHGMGFSEMFSYIRRWFPVLKCFIYGRQDNRIDEGVLNETAIYYCHRRQFDASYQARIAEILSQKSKLKVENVQERFIFNIDHGKHSIHFQRRFKPLVAKIIHQYLTVLEQI